MKITMHGSSEWWWVRHEGHKYTRELDHETGEVTWLEPHGAWEYGVDDEVAEELERAWEERNERA